jgi:hypothetical protein
MRSFLHQVREMSNSYFPTHHARDQSGIEAISRKTLPGTRGDQAA